MTDVILGERLFKTLLLNGGIFLKYGRTSRPLKRKLYVTKDLKYIVWCEVNNVELSRSKSRRKSEVETTVSLIAGINNDNNNNNENENDNNDMNGPVVSTPVKRTLEMIAGVDDENEDDNNIEVNIDENHRLLVTSLKYVQRGFTKKPFFKKGYKDEYAFTLVFESRSLRLLADSQRQRDFWVKSFEWLYEFNTSISRPYNVQHRFTVDEELKWKIPHDKDESNNDNKKKVIENTNNNDQDDGLNFELLELLGYGTYGRVHRAIHRMTGYELAVKLVFVDEDSEEIKSEINILKQMRHPNIVSYFGSWGPDTRYQLWILMELCSCGSIIDLLESADVRLTEEQIAYILFSTLKAIEYLHEKHSIVHRDIKGRNILITDDGEVKLTDFGGSLSLDEAVLNPMSVGTPYWMSPEVAEGKSVDFKSDVWSIGITAIELAEKTPPRSKIAPFDVLETIINEAPPKLNDNENDPLWSSEFHNFIDKCLQKNPQDRYTISELLKHSFFLKYNNLNSNILLPLCGHTPVVTPTKSLHDNSITFHSDGGLKNISHSTKAGQVHVWPVVNTIISNPTTVNPRLKSKYVLYTLTTSITPSNCDILALNIYEDSKSMEKVFDHRVPVLNSDNTCRYFQVQRRFNDFKFLHQLLISLFPGYLIPDLPSDEYVGRFKAKFINRRMLSLQWFIKILLDHAVIGRSRPLIEFLFRDNESWNIYMQQSKTKTPRSWSLTKLLRSQPVKIQRRNNPLNGVIKISERILKLNYKIAQIYRSLNALGKLLEPYQLCYGTDISGQLIDDFSRYMVGEWIIPLDAMSRLQLGLKRNCESYVLQKKQQFLDAMDRFHNKNNAWLESRALRVSKIDKDINDETPPKTPITVFEDAEEVKKLEISESRPLPDPLNHNETSQIGPSDVLLDRELRLASECVELQNQVNQATDEYRQADILYCSESEMFEYTRGRHLKTTLLTFVKAQIEHSKRQEEHWTNILDEFSKFDTNNKDNEITL